MSGIQINSGILICSITANPTTTTTSSSTMIVSITPPIMFPYNSTFTIILPRFWPMDYLSANTILTSALCQAGVNASSTIQCSMVISSNSIQLTIINIVASDFYYGVQFYINTIINPPST
jgi:hypothetical protein